MGRAVFVKILVPSSIPLMMVVSKARAVSCKAMGTRQAGTRSQGD